MNVKAIKSMTFVQQETRRGWDREICTLIRDANS